MNSLLLLRNIPFTLFEDIIFLEIDVKWCLCVGVCVCVCVVRYSYILGASGTFAKDVLPRSAAVLDTQQISEVCVMCVCVCVRVMYVRVCVCARARVWCVCVCAYV